MTKDARGTHEIKRTASLRSESAASSAEDSWTGVWLFVVFISLLSLFQCASNPHSGRQDAPKPPSANTATFRSLNSFANTAQIQIVLGGGSYEIAYESHESAWAFQSSSAIQKDVFKADFNTNKTSGDPLTASTYVLIGDLSLQISQLGLHDSLDSVFVQSGKNIRAYFNYANSERGPPLADVKRPRKHVIIIGTLTDLSFPELRGHSTLRANIVDLEPSEDVKQHYAQAMRKYEAVRAQEATGGKGSKPKPHVAGH